MRALARARRVRKGGGTEEGADRATASSTEQAGGPEISPASEAATASDSAAPEARAREAALFR